MSAGFTIAKALDGGYPYFNSFDAQNDFWYGKALDSITKSDAVVGLTSGAWNAIYGPKVTNLQYHSKNALASIGAKPWNQSGIRVQRSMSTSSGIGQTRGGSLPSKVHGDYNHVEIPYKEFAHTFAMNLGDVSLEGKDDILAWETLMELEAQAFINGIDSDLLGKVETAPTGFGSEEYHIDKLDRVISSYAEAVALTLTNGYESPWGGASSAVNTYRDKDAGTASNFDAYANNGSGTNRVLELSLIDAMFASCSPYWDNHSHANKVMITRPDTLAKLQAILQPQQRYEGFVSAQVDIEGVKTMPGRDTGYMVSAYNTVPMIPDNNVAGDGVGRIYLVDKDHMWYNSLVPNQVRVSDDPLINNALINSAVIFQMGELWADKFKGHGKLTYLK